MVRYWILFLNFIPFTVPEEAAHFQRHCDNQLYHQKRRNFYNGGVHIQDRMDSSATMYICVVTFFHFADVFLVSSRNVTNIRSVRSVDVWYVSTYLY